MEGLGIAACGLRTDAKKIAPRRLLPDDCFGERVARKCVPPASVHEFA